MQEPTCPPPNLAVILFSEKFAGKTFNLYIFFLSFLDNSQTSTSLTLFPKLVPLITRSYFKTGLAVSGEIEDI